MSARQFGVVRWPRCSRAVGAGVALLGLAGLTRGGGEEAQGFTVPWGNSQVRLGHTELIELQEVEPGLVTKVLVPLSADIAQWWASVDTHLYVKLIPCLAGGGPHVHLHIWGDEPFRLHGRRVDGVHTVIYLPQGTVIQDCQIDWVQAVTELPQLDDVGGKVRALHVTCPLDADGPHGAAAGHGILSGLFFKVLFTWLLLPWPILLLPLALWSVARPLFLAWGACLARCAHRAKRQQRVWRFRTLVRRAGHVVGAFGQGEPCCICLGEAGQDTLIALLPCRHALHDVCYRGWICTDSYPSRELICPLCRCPAKAVGRLAQ